MIQNYGRHRKIAAPFATAVPKYMAIHANGIELPCWNTFLTQKPTRSFKQAIISPIYSP
jgi:hypothetical protein